MKLKQFFAKWLELYTTGFQNQVTFL